LPDANASRPAVFLDRDGTLCEEVGYLNHITRLQIFPFAAAAVRRLNQAGFPVIVVTNQSGASRKIFPESLIAQVHERLSAALASQGARVDAYYYCPHQKSDNCSCRKPLPGLVERAAREHNLNPAGSWLIGDRYVDVELGHVVGARTILVMTGYGRGEYQWRGAGTPHPPHFVAEDLAAAVDCILGAKR
jgi:D-glycero-D-manno-heptose 1,7-bisphosphate phosphatase